MASPPPADAQITRGAISGTVKDQSGAVVPGATVTVTNIDTNASRVLVTDALGFYRAAAIEPGTYTVQSELAGFGTVETKNIVVVAASEVTIDFVLKPAALGETIQVTAEATSAQLNKTSGTISSVLNNKAVEELPLPGGRNINNLILTAPNASSTGGQGTFAVNGQRPRNNNYMIDGSDNNDPSVTISTTQLPPEAVQEFALVTNPYSVEFGRNSGGQVNVITKSGTNRFRGDAWEYYTSENFYSLNNIEKASGLSDPAKFRRHQYGFDLGGPLVKDRLFFYGLYQRDTQRPADTPGTTVRVLTPAGFAALNSVPLGAGQTAASRQAVLDRIKFLQDIYGQGVTFRNLANTLVNGVPIETGQTNVNITAPSTYNTYIGRGDYRLSASDTISARYTYTPREDINVISNCVFGALFCGNQSLLDTNLASNYTKIISPTLLNEFRFNWTRRDLDFPENDPNSPTATISGLFTVGGASNFPQYRVTDVFQFSDMATWTKGRHTVKFGADIRYNKVDNGSGFNSKGTFTFNSLQDYINNNAFQLQQALQTASFQADQWQTGFFVQDDFRITSELTINMGLRYETTTVPLGLFGATDAESLAALVPGPVESDTNNWGPRVGFAYSPRSQNALLGDGLTVFRGGFGMSYDVLFYNLLTVNGSNYPRVVTASLFNVQNVYPNLIPASGSAVFNPLAQYVNSAEDTETPESRFYSLSMQRQLGDYVFEVGWTGSRGYKGINQVAMNPAILTADQAALVRSTLNANAIPGVQARRLYPQFGARIVIPNYVGPGDNDVEARSEYNAVYFSANKRFSDGLQFGAAYTYSRWYSNNDASLGEGGTAQSSQRPQSDFDYEIEWSRSNFDRPHRLSVNYLWEIPGPDTGFWSYVAGGWQLSGVTQGQSGAIFTIFTGVDSNGDGSGADRPNLIGGSLSWDDKHQGFKNEGYVTVPLGTNNLPLVNSLGNGTLGRNTERARHYWNTDVGLMKRFRVVGNQYLMVRADIFNLLNQDNYGAPTNAMNSPSFGLNSNNWGRRSMQFAVKYSF
jgi:hypothetical protein